jgi:hypothetical protein
MITLREFPNRTFKSWGEAHAALKENEARLIGLKCSQVYKSIDKLHGFAVTPFMSKAAMPEKAEVPSWMKEGNQYPVINTTKYFDSHGDVHFDGLWKRSLKANVGKLYYAEAHSLKVADIIAWPEDVKSFAQMVPWSFLGKDYEGETQALVFEIPDAAIKHTGAREVIDNKREMQNSVRMQYVKMTLALNSESAEWKENKELYDSRIDLIANKDIVEQNRYFWAVDEAKIFKEGSMVIAGSNDATPIIYGDSAKSTSSEEFDSAEATRQLKIKAENAFYNNLI